MSQRVIYKYAADLSEQTYVIPAGYEVLSAHEQHGQICVWVEQDMFSTGMGRRVKFTVIPTGASFDSDMVGDYVGTVLLEVGALVFHVYAKEN